MTCAASSRGTSSACATCGRSLVSGRAADFRDAFKSARTMHLRQRREFQRQLDEARQKADKLAATAPDGAHARDVSGVDLSRTLRRRLALARARPGRSRLMKRRARTWLGYGLWALLSLGFGLQKAAWQPAKSARRPPERADRAIRPDGRRGQRPVRRGYGGARPLSAGPHRVHGVRRPGSPSCGAAPPSTR